MLLVSRNDAASIGLWFMTGGVSHIYKFINRKATLIT